MLGAECLRGGGCFGLSMWVQPTWGSVGSAWSVVGTVWGVILVGCVPVECKVHAIVASIVDLRHSVDGLRTPILLSQEMPRPRQFVKQHVTAVRSLAVERPPRWRRARLQGRLAGGLRLPGLGSDGRILVPGDGPARGSPRHSAIHR